jgi:hypothetical protein
VTRSFGANALGEVQITVTSLERVTFRFGSEIEVRYLPLSPEAGDFVAHLNGLWVVTFVSADAAGITVVCEFRDGDDRAVRHVA